MGKRGNAVDALVRYDYLCKSWVLGLFCCFFVSLGLGLCFFVSLGLGLYCFIRSFLLRVMVMMDEGTRAMMLGCVCACLCVCVMGVCVCVCVRDGA